MTIPTEGKLSDWVLVTQTMVDAFGRATLDSDPLHVDPEWCRAHGPHPHTIVFGAQTLALLVHFIETIRPVPAGMVGYNYGYDRVRFIAPVPVGSRIRAHFIERERIAHHGGGERVKMEATVEIEGSIRPALVADWLFVTVAMQKPSARG